MSKENRAYFKKFDPIFVEMLEKHLQEGWSFSSFGGKLGITYENLYYFVHTYPEFKAIKEKYRKQNQASWLKHLEKTWQQQGDTL